MPTLLHALLLEESWLTFALTRALFHRSRLKAPQYSTLRHYGSGRRGVFRWFSLTPTARFARASSPQLFRVWREAALVQQMALKRADFVRAFRSREPREHSVCGTFRSAACSILYVSITRVRARVSVICFIECTLTFH